MSVPSGSLAFQLSERQTVGRPLSIGAETNVPWRV